jgi:hypothetical protein
MHAFMFVVGQLFLPKLFQLIAGSFQFFVPNTGMRRDFCLRNHFSTDIINIRDALDIPDITAFFISGIRPDTGLQMSNIRYDRTPVPYIRVMFS